METCEKCGKPMEECICEQKYYDEEDLPTTPTSDEPVESEPEPDPVEPEPEPVDAPTEPKEEEWEQKAKEHKWVPDHVREKHAREAQVLRDQVRELKKQLDFHREPVDPNEPVLRREMDEVLDSTMDNALLSERVLRLEVEDYDEVVVNNLVPFIEINPWVEPMLRSKRNPAKAAYKLGCALRDGKKISFTIGPRGPEIDLGEEPVTPTRKTNPPVEALKQAQKQPKTIDSVPVASERDAIEMSPTDFWKLPTETLIRMRVEKPELYEKMKGKSPEMSRLG